MFDGRICILFSVLVVGCGAPRNPEPEDVYKQSIAQWQEAARILEGIRDESALRAAAGKLDALAQRMVELNRKASVLALDAQTRRGLEADNRKQSEAALKRFEDAALRVRGIPGGEDLVSRFRRGASRPF